MSEAEVSRLAGRGQTLTAFAGRIAGGELLILLLATPFLLLPNRWTPLAAAALALPWLARRAVHGTFSVATPADVPLAMMLVMAGVGLAASVDFGTSLEGFWRVYLGIAVFYGLVNAFATGRDLRWLGGFLVLAGLGLTALTLLGTRWQAVRLANLPQVYSNLPALLRDPEDNQSFNPRVMGMALAILLPVLVSLAVRAKDRRVRRAAAVVTVLMAAVLPLTQALQALLALGAGLGLLAVWRSRWFLLGLVPAAGIAGWAASHVDLRGLALRMLSPGNVGGIGVALRLDMWSRAIAMIRDLPFTGIGLNTYPQIQTHFYPGYLLGLEPHAHNLFLQLALDLGLPGLFAFLWLFVTAAWMCAHVCRSSTDRDERSLAIGATAGLAAYLGAGLIDSPWTPKPGILLWLLLGTLAAVCARVSTRKEAPLRPRVSWLTARRTPLLACVAVTGLLVFALPGARERNLGAVQAHQALYALRTGHVVSPASLSIAETHLEAAIAQGTDDAPAFGLLGSLYAWEEKPDLALAALERQIELDRRTPMAAYAPFEALRRRLAGDAGWDAAEDLLDVYSHWQARYPARAEPNLLVSLVESRLQDRPELAAATLSAALQNGAQPAGVIVRAKGRLIETH